MDNKYGLGSSKVAHEHHDAQLKAEDASAAMRCRFCQSTRLTLSPTMHDHMCDDCGEWQADVTPGYATGRSADY